MPQLDAGINQLDPSPEPPGCELQPRKSVDHGRVRVGESGNVADDASGGVRFQHLSGTLTEIGDAGAKDRATDLQDERIHLQQRPFSRGKLIAGHR
jgi:hypothetical protein